MAMLQGGYKFSDAWKLGPILAVFIIFVAAHWVPLVKELWES